LKHKRDFAAHRQPVAGNTVTEPELANKLAGYGFQQGAAQSMASGTIRIPYPEGLDGLKLPWTVRSSGLDRA
jgi:hypothetical protein